MKFFGYILCCWMLLTACGDQHPEKEALSGEDAGGETNTFKPGYYAGVLPCASCDGLYRQIVFLSDHRYFRMDQFRGSNTAPVNQSGEWEIKDGLLSLLHNDTVMNRFIVLKNGIGQTLESGKSIPDSLKNNYVLSQRSPAEGNPAWMKKKAAGIDLFVTGTEPFWLLEIDREKQVSFRLAENDQPIQFVYKPPVTLNGQWVYNLGSQTDALQILVTPGFCNNGMNDQWTAYKVEVRHKGNVYNGCGVMLNELFND